MTGSSEAMPTNRALPEVGKRSHFATRVIHAGQVPDPSTGAVMTPIYTTSTYSRNRRACTRARLRPQPQPDAFAFERCVADLEDGHGGLRSPPAWRRSRRCSSCSIRLARDRVRRYVRRHVSAVRTRAQVAARR